ncbi:hypothetical protein Hanom_Chr02g00174651 [Helianthus anomalus]
MAKRTCSASGDSAPTFTPQDLLQNPEREICSFNNVDIAALHSSGAFLDGAIFRPFDRDLQSYVKLAPPTPESVARIEAIYKLPEIERSFFPNQESSSKHSSSNILCQRSHRLLSQRTELDNYSGPVQVKKETPATTSSKPSVPPPRPTQTRARASGSKKRKRKGSDTAAAAPEGFSYDNLSFVDSFEPITSFLNKDKLKKVTLDAEVELAATQVEHEKAMSSFRDGLKNSAVVSLLQARIKMAYEAKDAGFECPTWSVDSWVAKLSDLGGSHVPYPTKYGTGEPLKEAEAAVEAGDKTKAGADAGEGGVKDAGDGAPP